MAQAGANPDADPRRKIDAAVIERPGTRRYRAAAFQIYVLVASVVFVVLAVAARTAPYFRIDLYITHAVQLFHGPIFDRLMYITSWVGFAPQAEIIGALSILTLYFTGLRWEALAALFAACGVGFGLLVKQIVYRPRPAGDLITVFEPLRSPSFPSGHVLTVTVFCGFFAFLAYTLLKTGWSRLALLGATILFAILMGLSRIYQGQHWFSDVMGAYLLGTLWLALSIKVYRWGKPRYFVHQPVAPEAPSASAPSAKA